MTNSGQRIKRELSALINEGLEILLYETEEKSRKVKKGEKGDIQKPLPTIQRYQSWYTKALPVVRQLIPERYQEFQEQYKLEKRKEITFLTYTISDYLIGLRVTKGAWEKIEVVNPLSAFASKFQHQLTILMSAQDRIDYILADIQGVLQSELFDNELEAANELFKKNHLRAAGALAGVTLESHLSRISVNHNVKVNKKNPTISDFNDELKNNGIYDVPDWRFIQRLGDIRNLCVHAKDRDPTKEEVDELIKGVQKVIKTLF
ncbi:MAG: hypothetical protein H3Z52_15910 [archaeon]|nr:hypothetical protein [archaeon]